MIAEKVAEESKKESSEKLPEKVNEEAPLEVVAPKEEPAKKESLKVEPTVVEVPKKDSVPVFAFALPKLADSKVSSQPATKSKTIEPDKKSPQQTTEAESTK